MVTTQMLETMPFELCMKIECQNASLYVTAAGKHLKNYPMKGEINILVSKHIQVPCCQTIYISQS
jgi:hypothetical protein